MKKEMRRLRPRERTWAVRAGKYYSRHPYKCISEKVHIRKERQESDWLKYSLSILE